MYILFPYYCFAKSDVVMLLLGIVAVTVHFSQKAFCQLDVHGCPLGIQYERWNA